MIDINHPFHLYLKASCYHMYSSSYLYNLISFENYYPLISDFIPNTCKGHIYFWSIYNLRILETLNSIPSITSNIPVFGIHGGNMYHGQCYFIVPMGKYGNNLENFKDHFINQDEYKYLNCQFTKVYFEPFNRLKINKLSLTLSPGFSVSDIGKPFIV